MRLKGDGTPKAKFFPALKNFLYAATFAANLLVMVLRLIVYGAVVTGLILTIISTVKFGSAYVFFEGLVRYLLAGAGLLALTEIINRRKNK